MEKDFSTMKDLSDEQAQEYLLLLITKAYSALGQKADRKIMTMQTSELLKDIRKNFNWYAIEDVDNLFYLGVRGQLGEYINLSIVTYFQWFTQYREQGLLKKPAVKALAAKNELSESEKLRIVHEGTLTKFEAFKKNGRCDDLNNVSYDYLAAKGVVDIPIEEKNKIYEAAKINVLSAKKAKVRKSKLMLGEKMDILNEIESISKDQSEITLCQAKKDALNLFFSRLITKKIELQNIISL